MLLIWGDADVIKMWNKFEIMGINNTDNNATLMVWDELLREIEKGFGQGQFATQKGRTSIFDIDS